MSEAPPYMNRTMRREHRTLCRELLKTTEKTEMLLEEIQEFGRRAQHAYAGRSEAADAMRDAEDVKKQAADMSLDSFFEQLRSLYYRLDNLPEDVR